MARVGKASPLRILVVEDNADTLDAICLFLKYKGYAILSARSKQEALKEVSSDDYDVLISDIGLSDGNGWDLIREMGKRRPSYAIAMSGYGTKADREKSVEAGFRHHFVKPVALEKLEAALKEVVAELTGQ
jgi:DNA-binding response OmpR family regulator